MSDIEIPLEGGNVNAKVVRIGDTVRRAMSPSSPTVHKLLLYLEAKGFDASPRFLGIDDKGRETLSFIEGETDFPPDIWGKDAALIAAAKMLREFHEATQDFVVDNAIWAKEYRDPTKCEVICHNDFAPYNFIYANGLPKAVIDFDLVGPGPRLRDVAYTAYCAYYKNVRHPFKSTLGTHCKSSRCNQALVRSAKTSNIAALLTNAGPAQAKSVNTADIGQLCSILYSGLLCALWTGRRSMIRIFPFDRGNVNDAIINTDHHFAVLNINLQLH